MATSHPPGLLARGPWAPEEVEVTWLDETFVPEQAATVAADDALQALIDRGSPSHDGLAARLVDFHVVGEGRLALTLQPARWSLRLVADHAAGSLAASCLVRASDGRWLAGRRAQWLASWPGRWALGAAGAVEVAENPVETLSRELAEEWSVQPERLSVEALLSLPSGMTMLVGMAWLPDGAEVVPDDEHDAHAWWPAEIDRWPQEASAPLRTIASLLTQTTTPSTG